MKRRSLKIIKINAQKSPQYKQEFVSQPVNYLKIIENKDKIKYEYLNKDFDPKNDLKQLSGRKLEYPNPRLFDAEHQSSGGGTHTNGSSSTKPMLKSDLGKYTFDIPVDSDDEDYHPKKTFSPPKPPIVEGIKDVSHTPPRPPNPPTPQRTPDPFVVPSGSYTPPRPQTIVHSEAYTPTRDRTPMETPRNTPRGSPEHEHVYNYDLHTPPREESHYSKLRDFLNGSDNEDSGDEYYAKQRKHNSVIDPYKYMSEEHKRFNLLNKGPPTLEELEKRGEYASRQEYMDVYKMDEMLRRGGDREDREDHRHREDHRDDRSRRSHQSSRRSSPAHSIASTVSMQSKKEETPESIDDKKQELLYKLNFLKKKYPEHAHNIPYMTMNNSLKELEYTYFTELKNLEIDNDVNDYRTYLIGFFMITEFVLGKFLRLDLEGFTQQQMLSMKRYERFLLEIGEKNYVPEGKKWPVELRLMGFVIIQAATFTATKMILKKTGTNLMGMFNTQAYGQNGGGNEGPKRKMRMPDVDLE